MSLDSALLIASGGLNNIAQQMAVVSNNVANAATPSYAEEVSTQTSLVGADGQGFGVLTGNVTRQIDLQLQQEMFRQNATVSGLQTMSQGLAPVNAAQGVPGQNTDLGSALGALQSAFTNLQTDPSNPTSQIQVVDAASTLAGQINTLGNAYQTARQNAQAGVQSGLQQLNTDIATVSQLSSQIVTAQIGGQSTAALENQRDVAMADMSSLANVSFIAQPNGGLIAAIGQGMLTIPMTVPAPQFSMANSAISPQAAYPGQGIAPIMLNGTDVTSQFNGGSIGANLTLRDNTLPGYQGQLDEFANTLQSRFAAQGLQLFSAPAGGTSTVVPTPVQTGYVGYAQTITVNPAVVANPSQVRDGNVTVAGSPTGSAAFTPNPANGPAGFEGLITNVLTYALGSQAQSGVAQTAPNVAGLGPLGNLSAPYSAPATLAGFASVLVSSQSADVSNTTTQLSTETAVQSTLSSQFTATSGVNTDTELSKMVALQNAYGANARIIGVAQAMWTQLLSSVQ
jgi:flagellar hook-associated protein 1 FlgK